MESESVVDPIETVISNYNLPLVILSVLVAIFSSSAALDISSRLKSTTETSRFRWVLVGAFILGLGIWSMHFIGMLAFHLSIDVSYRISMVIISILPAIAASGIAFYIVSRPAIKRKSLFIGAFFIGTGIISMHYLGMEAMEMNAVITYDPLLWTVSAAIAYVASFTGLFLLFYLPDVSSFHWHKLLSAILMGLAVSGMHYTGMMAAFFTPSEQIMDHALGSTIDTIPLAYSIGTGMLLLLAMASSTVRIDRIIAIQTKESELKFQSVIESANDAIIVADLQGIIIQWNHAAQLIFGYTNEEILGSNIDLILQEDFASLHRCSNHEYEDAEVAKAMGRTFELTGCKKDGSEFPLEISLGTWKTEKGVFFSSIIRDITERKLSEEKIKELVYLEPLTGLPNRRLFNERLSTLLEQAKRTGTNFSLFYMDLDNFKMINDTFGHSTGDLFLMEVAERLKRQLTEQDTLSRQGGDEFTLLLPETHCDEAAVYACNMVESLSEAFQFKGEEIFTSLSIGISSYPADGEDAETLIKQADMAMYRMKEEGKNGYQFFTKEMNQEISRKARLANDLRKATDCGEFSIHYQPQISICTEEIQGVEALLRWNHPELGNISPAEFIPIAEETGSIIKIGEFVLEQACRQNKAWQDAGLPPFRVAVNISARQFAQKDLMDFVGNALQSSGLAPQYLELELTESIYQNDQNSIDVMLQLKSMGIYLSIDDFGTGYSSLSYLKMFPIDTLKIDRQFTRNIETDPKDAVLVRTIIRMAHDLELNVIAEGVETKEQLEFLKNERCHQAQGYYFNRPLPPKEIAALYQTV
ncbi:bifunctional diguanylate cyclase/phosphodiesterase [Planococcus salinarum]|nr:bifunctional diguanylate cyclase/phosphodiesterase [Planococcus salinarum]